jgi:hypothetical protein
MTTYIIMVLIEEEGPQGPQGPVKEIQETLETENNCDLFGCENKSNNNCPNCKKCMCCSCTLNILMYDICIDKFMLKCPFCSVYCAMPQIGVVSIMISLKEYIKIIKNIDNDENMVIYIKPCDGGCYHCPTTTLNIFSEYSSKSIEEICDTELHDEDDDDYSENSEG